MTQMVMIHIDGEPAEVPAGTSLGAVLHERGPAIRRSLSNTPRGLYCGMGVCFECQVRIDGHSRRACLVPVAAGMRIETEDRPK